MDAVLTGFTKELIKLAGADPDDELRLYRQVRREQSKPDRAGLSAIRGHGRQVSRDYLASLLIGALAQPASYLLGGRISRALHNREIMRAMKGTRSLSRRRELARYLQKGPLVGRAGFATPIGKKPIMSYSDLAGHAGRGALMGSVIQMLRDRYSGSAGAGD